MTRSTHPQCASCGETFRLLAVVEERGHGDGLVEPAWAGDCSCTADNWGDTPGCPRDDPAMMPTVCAGCATTKREAA